MLLDNFDYWQYYRTVTYFTTTSANVIIAKDANPMKNTDGESFQAYGSSLTTISQFQSAYGFTLTVGTGNSAPAKTDYKLDNCVDSSITFLARTWARALDAEKNTHIIVRGSGYYTGNDTITLREVGLYKSVTTASGTTTKVLLARALLDNPITIGPNDSFAIEYEIVFGQGTVTEVTS